MTDKWRNFGPYQLTSTLLKHFKPEKFILNQTQIRKWQENCWKYIHVFYIY